MIAEAPGQTTINAHPYRYDQTPSAPVLRDASSIVEARLDELIELPPDWDGYGAQPIDRQALIFAARVIDAATRHGLPTPEIFPVPSGGVQLEWVSRSMELEFEIEPGANNIVFVGDDSRSGRRFDGVLPGDQALFQHALANLVAGIGERRRS